MKNKTATRDRLINAGISLIKVNSVQKLTLRQIAHEAGVTTGAFYKSFPNRQVYFRELANKVSSEWAAIIEPELAGIPLATERLLFLGDNLMRTIVAQPNLAHFVLETPVVSFSDDELAKWPLLNLTFRNVKAVLDEHSRIDKFLNEVESDENINHKYFHDIGIVGYMDKHKVIEDFRQYYRYQINRRRRSDYEVNQINTSRWSTVLSTVTKYWSI